MREQEIYKRIESLEINDVLNIASNKINEKMLDEILFGQIILKEDSSNSELMRAVEKRMFEYITKLDDIDANKAREDNNNFILNMNKPREASSSFKLSDTKLVKIANDESVKYELVSDMGSSTKQDFLNTHFLDGISNTDWRNPLITRDVIMKMDQTISKK